MSGIRFSDDFKKDAVSQPIDLELVAALKGAHGAVEAAVEGIGMSPYLQVLVVF